MKTSFKARLFARRRELAFTLIEIMVAVAIIAVVFVSLYSGITMGFAVINQARENLRATQVMLDRLEEFRIYNWTYVHGGNTNGIYGSSVIPTNFWVPFFPTGSYTNSDITTNCPTNGFYYACNLAITSSGMTESYATNIVRVTLTVKWTNGVAARTRTLTTLVSEYGMQNYLF
ncbi:MAG: type II secretion system protein [Verrucomicrobia bacterium]|nr:type II secretion system protein [Verrucomicrobiota bacterium]